MAVENIIGAFNSIALTIEQAEAEAVKRTGVYKTFMVNTRSDLLGLLTKYAVAIAEINAYNQQNPANIVEEADIIKLQQLTDSFQALRVKLNAVTQKLNTITEF